VKLFLLCGPAFRDFIRGRLRWRRSLSAGGDRHEQSENGLAHNTVHLGFLRADGKETGERFNELSSVAKYVSKTENVARPAVLLLLPIAVHECVHWGVPKPIRWDPTDCAVIGEECVGLFLGEDGLGV
jgi:hypothetical protein